MIAGILLDLFVCLTAILYPQRFPFKIIVFFYLFHICNFENLQSLVGLCSLAYLVDCLLSLGFSTWLLRIGFKGASREYQLPVNKMQRDKGCYENVYPLVKISSSQTSHVVFKYLSTVLLIHQCTIELHITITIYMPGNG